MAASMAEVSQASWLRLTATAELSIHFLEISVNERCFLDTP